MSTPVFMIQSFCQVLRLCSPYLSDNERKNVSRVYWLSRHQLTEEQKMALFFLHHQNVEVYQPEDVAYFNAEDFVNVIKNRYADGFCYVVAPEPYIEAAQRADCIFGSFNTYISGDDTHLNCVYHWDKEGKRKVLGAHEIQRYLGVVAARA